MEGDCTRTLLITANVGSIFEEPETMFPGWLDSFFKCVQTHKPGILALHCQEVGGKNYEASMQHVNQFVKTLLSCEELHKYDRARIFLDEDYTASDKFTALGNLYFIHEDVSNVLIWDFVDCKFVEVEGREVLSGNIENVPIKEKAKFPQHFFPEFKWSRKGFLRTRLSVNNCIFDLVNIHLFHDASNIVAMESSPSLYAGNRQRALIHTLQRFENDKYSKVPLFIFGDFNFRLDSYSLIKELTGKLVACQTKGKKDLVNKIEYTEEGNGKIVLTVAIKNFDYYEKHTDLFASMNKWLHQYDTEFSSFRDRFFEHDISFPPSYPFCEDVNNGISYMKTRVPSWCDRVLLSHSSKDIISQDSSHTPVYDLIGKDVCMGDHKPVYLYILMKPGKGNKTALYGKQELSLELGLQQQQQRLRVESKENTPELSLPDSPMTPGPMRPRTLSINGEKIVGRDGSRGDLSTTPGTEDQLDWSTVNIHDYAKFEQEKYLIPEFRNSIKKIGDDEEGQEEGGMRRKRSFKELASKVRTMEKVLKMWPRRPRTRHHSSSSEDFSQSESEVSSRGRAADHGMSDGRTSETTSIDTASVDFNSADSHSKEDGLFIPEDNNNKGVWNVGGEVVDIALCDVVTPHAIELNMNGSEDVGLDIKGNGLPKAVGLSNNSDNTTGESVVRVRHGGVSIQTSNKDPATSVVAGVCNLDSSKVVGVVDAYGGAESTLDVVPRLHETDKLAASKAVSPDGKPAQKEGVKEAAKHESTVDKNRSTAETTAESAAVGVEASPPPSTASPCWGNCRCVVL